MTDDEPPDTWDRAAAWLAARGTLPALAALTIFMGVLYAGVFRGELVGDDLSFHMAESARIADCLRAGDFDFWNPSANGGYASIYYYQAVPQLVSAIPTALFGHHLFWFQLSNFLPLVLAPAAAYRGMRVLGATPWQAFTAAFAVGLMNGASRWGAGAASTFRVGLYTQTWALAIFPLALASGARWVTTGRQLATALAWGTFCFMCHPFAGVALALALGGGWIVQPVLRGIDLLLGVIARALDPRRPGEDPAKDSLFRRAEVALGERWRNPPDRELNAWPRQLLRLVVLGACFAVAWMPVWLPLIVDYSGFGGFPHRVGDEVGPGFGGLMKWHAKGEILDYGRALVLTWALPIVAILARARWFRWLWTPALAYAALLALGPHIGKTSGDDLFPAVRFLGAMQVTLALAIGAGALVVGKAMWDAAEGSPLGRASRIALVLTLASALVGGAIAVAISKDDGQAMGVAMRVSIFETETTRWVAVAVLAALVFAGVPFAWIWLRTQYGVRTGLAALGAALGALMVVQGAAALGKLVNVLGDYPGSHRSELRTVVLELQKLPPGRKQVGEGAVSHWWNLLSYEYGRRPSLLQMGGGGLQASPNYDYLWTVHDFAKLAWVYDAPYLLFGSSNAAKMPVGEEVLKTANYTMRKLPAPGVVSPVQVTGVLPADKKAAHAASIAWLQTTNASRDHVLAYDGFGVAGPPAAGTVLRSGRQDSPGDDADIYAVVEATGPTTFMARESWHPRWHAYIDGVEAPVRRVTPFFPAVDVPAGKHVLAFRFERPWWATACWLAWPLSILGAWLATRRRNREARAAV